MTDHLEIGSLTLPAPALFLAPMEDVTTGPFRAVCRRLGADVVFTEFVHAPSLARGSGESRSKIRIRPEERPVGIQIFGDDATVMAEAAERAMESEPDLLDINIGCPVRKVVVKGAGAALLRDLPRTERIVREIVTRANVPVTAKARIGWDLDSICVLDLARMLEANGVAALTVHARTRVQGYDERADWRWIARVKQAVSIPVVGNGDVESGEDAKRMLEETGCDGVMLGRAAIARPWVFREIRHYLKTGEELLPPTMDERVGLLVDLLRSRADEKGERAAVREMRKFYGPFLWKPPRRGDGRVGGGQAPRHFAGPGDGGELRSILLAAESANEVEALLRSLASEPGGMPPAASARLSPQPDARA